MKDIINPYNGVRVIPATVLEVADAIQEPYKLLIPREVALHMAQSVLSRFAVLKQDKPE